MSEKIVLLNEEIIKRGRSKNWLEAVWMRR